MVKIGRRGFVIGGLMTAAAPVAAFAQSAPAVPARLAELRQAGVVKIGVANQPPYSGVNPDGSITGIAPTIVQMVMAKLGVPKVEGIVAPYGQLIPGLQAKRWDMIGAALTITKERCGQVLYVDPVTFDGGVIVFDTAEVKSPPKTIADAASAKLKVGALTGSYLVKKLIDLGIAQDNIAQFPDNPSLFDGIAAERVQVGVTTYGAVLSLKTARPSFGISYPLPEDAPRGSAPAFSTADTELHALFQKELRALKQDGTFLKLSQQFGFEVPAGMSIPNVEEACQRAT